MIRLSSTEMTNDTQMEQLTSIIETATQSIQRPYFLLPIDGGPAVYRERVYCYELYHQMRKLWPEKSPFILNGEVDKSAHPLLRELGIKSQKPDLLVHGPGCMSKNHAIIEVKHVRSAARGISKDIETFERFADIGYRRSVYLVYGEDSAANIRSRFDAAFGSECPIELWFHSCVGHGAKRIYPESE